jgi:hypothetical protein
LVGSHEVSKEQRELLAEAARLADVDVSASGAGELAEAALGPFEVVGSEDVAEPLERRTEGSSGSNAATEIWMSMIGLAASPGTAVEPM